MLFQVDSYPNDPDPALKSDEPESRIKTQKSKS